MTTELRRAATGAMLLALLLALGCGRQEGAAGSRPAARAPARWTVTAWGPEHEAFAEVEPLVAGETRRAWVHVTELDGFQPLASGPVALVLTGEDGEELFRRGEPAEPGIFPVELTPRAPGEYDLAVRIGPDDGRAELAAGRVRIGSPSAPGSPVVRPAPRGGTGGGEPVSFSKEAQWRSRFATAWVERGRLPRAVRGRGRVRPPAGGEVVLTAPVDGTVASTGPWPHPGLVVASGAELLRVLPRPAGEVSLAGLGADVTALEAEHDAARRRLERLERLLELEAVARREVEELGARVVGLEARLEAARSDLEAARAARRGGIGAPEAVALAAPFAGRVAAVDISPGQAVAVGERLGRLVATEPVWVRIDLDPRQAGRVESDPVRLELASAGEEPVTVAGEDLELIARAPELDAATGTVAVFVEVRGLGGALPLGRAVEADLVLADAEEGIVVPATALVDDGGVDVVYLQLAGERFVRQPVTVRRRLGGRVLVDGLEPGQRLVTRGGEAVRRATLMRGGAGHGHAHGGG